MAELRVEERAWWKSGIAGVWATAVGTVLVHAATGWRYGFNRDELMALEDARHLAWGYVQYPPMTAFFASIALKVFGTSLVGFRFFAAVAQAVALVLTGMMAKEIAKAVASDDWRMASNAEGNCQTVQRWSQEEIRKTKFESRGDWAAVVAAGAGVPFCLGGGALMQYISFDYVCWALVAYGMVRVFGCKGVEAQEYKNGWRDEQTEPWPVENGGRSGKVERGKGGGNWWVVVGAGIGLGMMAKWTMVFLVAGVVAGVLATDGRRHLRSGWLWLGVLVALVIWAPNAWWEWKRGFPSLDFLRFLHARDVAEGLTDWFLLGQLELTLLAFPLAIAGLCFCFFVHEGKPYRAIGWMYLVPLTLLLVMRGRDYYLAPAYPMLYAAGAVWMEIRSKEVEQQLDQEEHKFGEAKTENRKQTIGDAKTEKRDLEEGKENETAKKSKGATVRLAVWFRRWLPAILVVDAVVAGCVALPIMPVNSRWWNLAAQVDTVLPEELGWEELAETVAKIRNGLPERERAGLGILARNYGEIGALNLYGANYGLPRAISGVNSSWERGYGNPPPETIIVVGYSREFLEKNFAMCELAGHTWNRYGVANEETIEDPDIFVCRGLNGSWEEFWKKVRLFA
jgi:hypothetical protein